MNVKSRHKGKHKRNISMDPVRSSADWKLKFLEQFSHFLKQWEESRKPGLSRETFFALKHSCLALSECAKFLLDRRGFNFILLGRLQSDGIESRFGWLRQLSGANYLISTKQVLDSDRKIRALSLVKFSGLSLSDIDNVLPDSADGESTVVDNLADAISEATTDSEWPSSNDASIIFYISGAIARSIVQLTKCDHCREALINPDTLEPFQLDEFLDYKASTFLDCINRGGLTRPSDYTFMVSVQCWQTFENIRNSTELKAKFLSSPCHRLLFTKIMDRLALDLYNYCAQNHDLKDLIVRRFFNCLAKNLVSELTNKACEIEHRSGKKKRKIEKLQSSSGH